MKHSSSSTSNPYDAWTPDLQVQALKRVAQSIFMLAAGVAFFAVSRWFSAPLLIIMLGYIGLIVSTVVAPLVFMTSGLMAGDQPYAKRQRFSDEFCLYAIASGYKAVSWVLVMSSVALFFFAGGFSGTALINEISVQHIGGVYVLLAGLTWAIAIIRLVKEEATDEQEEYD
ncbi:hypothetical protein CWE09_11200 [Aliidiomarina minuta]|uniref:Uncharacterized protein n=1 Tax=Aliidiomarina minuta TaxID=880057 RepID=A0A432W4I7_9GAMM|nr:hypothetical protein [Aliidiomarina minuta]RUO24422.1 hypothetical protein CWE09_11200 [Aliidiomarina minuta]